MILRIGQVWMILRRPQLPRRGENHEAMLRSRRRGIGRDWMFLRRTPPPRREETHEVMLRSRRRGVGQVWMVLRRPRPERGEPRRHAEGMLGVCSGYAQGMLRVCSGYAQGSVRAGWEGFGGSGGARDTREWDPTRTLGPKKVMKQVWG